jgi:hypothetical protein
VSSSRSPVEGASVSPHRHQHTGQAATDGGGARQRNLTSRLRFCAVAVSRTSSLAPLKPRSRSRSSLRMRFICANRISTFLRSLPDFWKASVLANARTRSRKLVEVAGDLVHDGRRALRLQCTDRAVVLAGPIIDDVALIDIAGASELCATPDVRCDLVRTASATGSL